MNFERPMRLELTGQEVALVYTALSELPAKHVYDLLRKMEVIDAAQTEQANKVPSPPLKMVSNSVYAEPITTTGTTVID